MRPRGTSSDTPWPDRRDRQACVKRRQERVKTPGAPLVRHFAGSMSIESGLMTAVVIVLAIYLLAALILPERFQ